MPRWMLLVAVVLVCTWWIVRLVRARALRRSALSPAALALDALAVSALVGGLTSVRHWTSATPSAVALVAVTLAVAALAGWLRSRTVRLWADGGEVMRQGGIVTVVSWFVWLAVHYGLDRLIDAADPASHLAATTLYGGLAVSLAVQGHLLRRRAAALEA